MKEHEIEVKNETGEVFVVAKEYYEANTDELTPTKKAAKVKMEKAPLKNKGAQ